MLTAIGAVSLRDDAPISDAEAAELFRSFETARGLLLAVSGGPDSMAMMLLFARWRGSGTRPKLFVATVDHGLRAQSRREAEAVAGWAAALGLRHRILTWRGAKPSTAVQEAARAARHERLAAHAAKIGVDHIVLAHHADDQAETVLFRLLRGSGPAGLAAMATRQNRDGLVLARPFLAVPKSRLIATCVAAEQPYLSDPSNKDDRFARVRLRALMPLLMKEGLSREGLLRLSRRAARANEALQQAADKASLRVAPTVMPNGISADLDALRQESVEVVIRVVGGLVGAMREDRTPLRLERLEALVGRLMHALRTHAPLKGTIGGLVIRLDDQGKVTILREKTRRRGRQSP